MNCLKFLRKICKKSAQVYLIYREPEENRSNSQGEIKTLPVSFNQSGNSDEITPIYQKKRSRVRNILNNSITLTNTKHRSQSKEFRIIRNFTSVI